MVRLTCSQLRTHLQEIKSLKKDFDLELPKIKNTRDTSLALSLEEQIREKFKSMRWLVPYLFVKWEEVKLGAMSQEKIIQELKQQDELYFSGNIIYVGLSISANVKYMLNSPEFIVSQEPRIMKLARFKVSDLGFNKRTTLQEIYEKSQKLGLELCPPEVGPLLRLHSAQYFGQEQPEMGIKIGMRPISNHNGDPKVFEVRYHSDGKWALDGSDARLKRKYHPDKEFVFMRK